MVLVLADDFTGAAELAGEAVARGFTAEVQTDFHPAAAADVVAVDTGTRSLSPDAAARIVARVTREMPAARPEWVFKKVDSLLRGHVVAEMQALAEAADLGRVLLAPANPSKGRTLSGGVLWIGGTPLAETPLAADPEYPRTTSDVRALLDPSGEVPIRVLGQEEALSGRGISVVDAGSEADLLARAREIDSGTLAAGALDFFRALLAVRGVGVGVAATGDRAEAGPAGARLWLCGSAAAWRSGREAEARRHGVAVFPMPDGLLEPGGVEEALEGWCRSIGRALAESGAALVAIGREEPLPTSPPVTLVHRLAEAGFRLLHQHDVSLVYGEGGGTAAALAARMGWTRFRVSRRLADGVVELLPFGIWKGAFVAKVGSYSWPEDAWGGASGAAD